MTYYTDYRNVPAPAWPYRHFSAREIACKGTGALLVNDDALRKLDTLRTRIGKPLILTSAYRSPEHNKRVGGKPGSKHMQGIAFDVVMANHDPVAFEAAARESGFTSFGYYPAKGVMHIDTRDDPATWGTPFPSTATGWGPEPKPHPENIREDRTAQGAAAIGIVGVGGAVAELLPGVASLGQVAQVVAIVALVALVGYALWRR